jgi:import inner membrane translocase subunit TIM23
MFTEGDFGDIISFTVGSSYCAGFILGFGRGIINGLPKSFLMPKKLIMNNFFNSVGKETTRLGNAFAGAGLIYYLMGGAINFLLEDYVEDMQPINKNMLCGALTGMVFKSTLGFTPICVGGILGASIIGGLTKLV